MKKIYKIEMFVVLIFIFLAAGIYGSVHYLNLLETTKQIELLATGFITFSSIMVALILFYLSKFVLKVKLGKKKK